MTIDQCRAITTSRLDSWTAAVRELQCTPACLIWINHEPGGEEFHISITDDADEFAIADLLEGLGRLLRRQAIAARRKRHDR